MIERKRNIAVGVTAVLGILGLAFLSILFGGIPVWMEKGYVIQVYFDDAGGVVDSSRIQLDGMDIGRVLEVSLQIPPKRGVHIVGKIREGILIPAASEISVLAPLLGGSRAIAFSTKKLTDAQLVKCLSTDGNAAINGITHSMMADLQSTMQEAVLGFREDFQKTIKQFEIVQADFTLLSKQWTRVGENVNQLIEPRDLKQVDAGKANANLSTVVARLDKRMTEIHTTIESINQWVADPMLKKDIRETLANAKGATKSWKKAADEINANVSKLSTRVYSVADDLSKLIKTAEQTVRKTSQGNGSAAKLLNDPSLYNNLNDAASRLSQLLDDVKLLVEKLKAEGIKVKL